MIRELKLFEQNICKPLKLNLSNISEDLECQEYDGYNFMLDKIQIKYRKSKLTPKKVGQFVTFWKRDPDHKAVPFDYNDSFDYYIIYTEEAENTGYFIFPKQILLKQDYISGNQKKGKNGFRLYADWHQVESNQAKKTQLWQTDYFINLQNPANIKLEKLNKIFDLETL